MYMALEQWTFLMGLSVKQLLMMFIMPEIKQKVVVLVSECTHHQVERSICMVEALWATLCCLVTVVQVLHSRTQRQRSICLVV